LGPKEAVGRKCYEVFQKRSAPCAEDEMVCPLKEVIRKKRHIRQVMTRVGMNGETRHFEINMYPIWEKFGKISKFIEISRDITDRLKEEEEITRRLEEMVDERTRQLKETHAKLLHQDKMSSLGKLAASVVHEINNPIAGILNLTLLVKRMLAEPGSSTKEMEKIYHYLGLMETETLRISRIVSNLLAFSRQSKLELTPVNPNRLIDKTLILNDNLLKLHGVKVEKRLDPRIPDILGSEDQLQQAFMNFISNAAEAMEPQKGGLLVIESKHSAKDNRLSIIFRDTGIGIPQDNLPRIFEPFFTTKKDGKGVGLGLSVAYGIIQEHGGSIYIQSKPGKGTTLKVRLPLTTGPVHVTRKGVRNDKH
jgi:two-component system NtrC family sensor kinase